MRSFMAWLRKEDKSFFEQAIIIIPIIFAIRTFVFGLYLVPSGSMETTMLVGGRYVADKFTVWFSPIQRGEIISLNSPVYQYSENVFVNWFQRYIWGPDSWTKRVIGIPGDHIVGAIEDGKPVVYLNGSKIDEPYINQYPLIYMWQGSVPTMQDRYLGLVGLDVRSFDPSKPFDQQPFYNIDPKLICGKQDIRPINAVYDESIHGYLSYPHVPLANGDDVFDVVLGENQYWLMGDNRMGSLDSRSWGAADGRLIHGRIAFCFFTMQLSQAWSWLIFDQSWWITDLILHPIDFWHRIRWSQCMRWVR